MVTSKPYFLTFPQRRFRAVVHHIWYNLYLELTQLQTARVSVLDLYLVYYLLIYSRVRTRAVNNESQIVSMHLSRWINTPYSD